MCIYNIISIERERKKKGKTTGNDIPVGASFLVIKKKNKAKAKSRTWIAVNASPCGRCGRQRGGRRSATAKTAARLRLERSWTRVPPVMGFACVLARDGNGWRRRNRTGTRAPPLKNRARRGLRAFPNATRRVVARRTRTARTTGQNKIQAGRRYRCYCYCYWCNTLRSSAASNSWRSEGGRPQLRR